MISDDLVPRRGNELVRRFLEILRRPPRDMGAQCTLFSARGHVWSTRVKSDPLMWPRSASRGVSPKMASFASNRPNALGKLLTVLAAIPFSRIGLYSSWALWIRTARALHAHNSGCAPISRQYLCFDLSRSRGASGQRAREEISRDTPSPPRDMGVQCTLSLAHGDVQSAQVESDPLGWPRSVPRGTSLRMDGIYVLLTPRPLRSTCVSGAEISKTLNWLNCCPDKYQVVPRGLCS